ncbi:MAG: hypothetical protein HYT87_14330 [Nitrospirae bacterium]|nr:hypothetical protein [Nitrospirota bacterium]
MRILENKVPQERVDGDWVAHDLFTIHTPEAEAALKKILVSDKFNATNGFTYALNGKLKDWEKDAFISQYVLRSTSTELVLSAIVEEETTGNGQQFVFGVTLHNQSKNPLNLYGGLSLAVRSNIGHFRRHFQYIYFEQLSALDSDPASHELAVNDKRRFEVHCAARRVSAPKGVALSDSFFNSQGLFLYENPGVLAHSLGQPGTFQVYFMYELTWRLSEYFRSRLVGKEIWTGRVVSKPVDIVVRPVL